MSEGAPKPNQNILEKILFNVKNFGKKKPLESSPNPDTIQPQEAAKENIDVKPSAIEPSAEEKKARESIAALDENIAEIIEMVNALEPPRSLNDKEKSMIQYLEETRDSLINKFPAIKAEVDLEAKQQELGEAIKGQTEEFANALKPNFQTGAEGATPGESVPLPPEAKSHLEELLVEKEKIMETVGGAKQQLDEDGKKAIEEIDAQLAALASQYPDLKIEKETAEPELKQLVEDILTGQYILSREMEKGSIRKKKGAKSVIEDLGKIFGKGAIKFRTDSEGKINGIDEFQSEIIDKEFAKQEKKEKSKIVKGIIKFVLGGAVAGGTIAAVASAPLWLLAVAPAIFGIGASFIGRGLIEFVHGLRMRNDKDSSRVEIEKDDWKKYGEVFALAKEIENGNCSEKQAILKLVTTMKEFEKSSLERHKKWQKSEKIRKIAELSTGAIFGAAGLAAGILYAKQKLIEEALKHGLQFDFNSDNIYHLVKKTKAGFAFIYQNSNDAYDSAQRYVAHTLGKKVSELGPGADKYIHEMVKNMTKLQDLPGDPELYGKFGGHALNPQTQESITRHFKHYISSKYSKEMITNLYVGITGIAAQFAELLTLKKPLEESTAKMAKLSGLESAYQKQIKEEETAKEAEGKTQAEKDALAQKEAEERAKEAYSQAKPGEQYKFNFSDEHGRSRSYRFEVLEKYLSQDGEEKISFKDIDQSQVLKNKDGSSMSDFAYSRQEFNKLNGGKWEHPHYSPAEWDVFDRHIDLVSKIHQHVVLPIVPESMEGLTLTPGKEYAVYDIDANANTISLYERGKSRDNPKQLKLTEILPHIVVTAHEFEKDTPKSTTKEAEGDQEKDTKKTDDREKTEKKKGKEQKTSKEKCEVGDQVKFTAEKDGPELIGKVIKFTEDGKKADVEVIEPDGSTRTYQPTSQYMKKIKAE